MPTNIQWTDETWNPIRGCSIVSPGCENCCDDGRGWVNYRDRKGGDPAEWPEDLRVREMPDVAPVHHAARVP